MELVTNRLFLRQTTLSDKEAMHQYRSDVETNLYLDSTPMTIEEVEAFIKNSPEELNIPGTWFQLGIIEKASNQFIGDVGLHFLVDKSDNKQVEIGYTLSKKFRGNGFATEAVKEVVSFLFGELGKHRVIASVDPQNRKSTRVLERLGFRKEGLFKKGLYLNGEWVDDLIYAVLASEWRENSSFLFTHK